MRLLISAIALVALVAGTVAVSAGPTKRDPNAELYIGWPNDGEVIKKKQIRVWFGLRNMGDYALGTLSSCWYTAQLDNPINKRFVETYRKENGYDPGQYASGTYLYGEVLAAAIGALKGKIEDKDAFIKALRAVRIDTLRGPITFDDYGNVVGNIYIRRVEKKGGQMVNTNIYTYPNVSQFWSYNPKEFLKHPVWSRDYPPMKAS